MDQDASHGAGHGTEPWQWPESVWRPMIERAGTTALSRAKTITSARGSWGLG